MRSAVSFALMLACAMCAAGPYTDLKAKLDNTSSDAEVIRLVTSNQTIASQKDISESLSKTDYDAAGTAKNLRAQIDLRAMAESPKSSGSSAQQAARTIKESPFYRDPGIDRKRNWLADALERLKNIKLKPEREQQGVGAPSFLGALFTVVVWCLLATGVLTLLYFAVRHIRWQRTLTRKSKTLLEDDEPDRSLDEWLQLADELATAGRHREAVRALYLACLIKFDEADVARFDRGETNWEHLARFEESPKRPRELDFRTPTQQFDRIWYGFQTRGMPDVDQFRRWYQEVSQSLRGVKV